MIKVISIFSNHAYILLEVVLVKSILLSRWGGGIMQFCQNQDIQDLRMYRMAY